MFKNMINSMSQIAKASTPCEVECKTLLAMYIAGLDKGSKLRISKMYSFCPYKEGLMLLHPGLERVRKDESQVVMDYGTANHRVWQKYYLPTFIEGVYCNRCNIEKKQLYLPSKSYRCPNCNSPLRYKEISVTDPVTGITGHPDGVQLDDNNIRILFEIKSLEEEKYEAYTEPSEEHIYQASIYAELTESEYIKLLITNRNGNARKRNIRKFFEADINRKALPDMRRKYKNYVDYLQDADALNIQAILPKLIKHNDCTNIKYPPAVWCEHKKYCFC